MARWLWHRGPQVCPVFNKGCDQAPLEDPGVYSNEPNLAVFNKESLHPEFELSQVWSSVQHRPTCLT